MVPEREADVHGAAVEVLRGELVRVTGPLDVHVAADVRLLLLEVIPRGRDELVVDLGDTSGVDATGLGVLLGAHRAAGRAGRRLVLLDPPPRVLRLLVATRLDRVLAVRRSSACA